MGKEGYGMQGEPLAAEAGMMLEQPEACRVFPRTYFITEILYF